MMTGDADHGSLTCKHYHQLILTLGLIDLSDDERRIVEWLAGWDQSTVDAVCSLLLKVSRP